MKRLLLLVLPVILLLVSGCEKDDSPTSAHITRVDVTSFPPYDGGSDWDPLDGPDIYVKIWEGTALQYNAPTYYSEATTGSTYTWDLSNSPAIIDVLTATVYVDLYDYDVIDPDDFMTSANVKLSNYKDSKPSTISITGTDFAAKIYVSWYK